VFSALPQINDRLQAMDFVAAPTTPEALDRILRADIAPFAKVGRLVGLIAAAQPELKPPKAHNDAARERTLRVHARAGRPE
jgi:hypothetical protein